MDNNVQPPKCVYSSCALFSLGNIHQPWDWKIPLLHNAMWITPTPIVCGDQVKESVILAPQSIYHPGISGTSLLEDT